VLYLLWIYAAEMSKMIDLCLSGVFLQALKICQNSFSARGLPKTPLGSLRRSPRPPSRLGRGTAFGILILISSASVVWPPTSLKFVHLALRLKRLDTSWFSVYWVWCYFAMLGTTWTGSPWEIPNSVLHVDRLRKSAQEISRPKSTQTTRSRCMCVA